LISGGASQQACEAFVGLSLKAGYKKYMHTTFHWVLHLPQDLQSTISYPALYKKGSIIAF